MNDTVNFVLGIKTKLIFQLFLQICYLTSDMTDFSASKSHKLTSRKVNFFPVSLSTRSRHSGLFSEKILRITVSYTNLHHFVDILP